VLSLRGTALKEKMIEAGKENKVYFKKGTNLREQETPNAGGNGGGGGGDLFIPGKE